MSLSEQLEELNKNFSVESSDIQAFQSAIENFDAMVERGITQKRGYNLQTISNGIYYSHC